MSYVNDFRELKVYKEARTLSSMIFEVTRDFPKSENYSLTDQIRRSSRSIGAQIAEAWAKRRYPKHFISKLTDASAEQQETIHWLEISNDCSYLSDMESQKLIEECSAIGKMLNRMITKSHTFCK